MDCAGSFNRNRFKKILFFLNLCRVKETSAASFNFANVVFAKSEVIWHSLKSELNVLNFLGKKSVCNNLGHNREDLIKYNYLSAR